MVQNPRPSTLMGGVVSVALSTSGSGRPALHVHAHTHVRTYVRTPHALHCTIGFLTAATYTYSSQCAAHDVSRCRSS